MQRPIFEDICRRYGLKIESVYGEKIKATIDELTVATWELCRECKEPFYVKWRKDVLVIPKFFIGKGLYSGKIYAENSYSKMIVCYTTDQLEENIEHLLKQYKQLCMKLRKLNLDKDFY